MTDNKLYIVLTHFDKVEQNRLRKYIRSPYFNVNETLMIFYDILTEHINKNGKAGALVKENIWKKLFGKESFSDVRFRKLGSDLLKLIEGFLAQEIYDDNSLEQASYLIEAVNKKKLEKLYSGSIRNAQLISEQQHQKPASFYYYQYLIEKNYFELSEVELKRSEKSNVENIINNLDYFYLAEKLHWYSSVLSRKQLVSHEYELLFIDEIVEHINNHKYENIPAITVYYNALLTQTDSNNDENYRRLTEVLEENSTLLPRSELYQLYSSVLNYCILKVNQGNQSYLREFHENVKYIIETEIIFNEKNTGELNPWLFKNIVLIALRLSEYEWTEKFIKDYKERLPIESRDNAVSYNLALVYFYQKKYNKVIPLLNSVEYEDLSYNLGSKSMLIAIYYEQDDYEPLVSLTDTFKTYLNRHKDINEKMRLNYLHYIQFVRKLTKIMPGDNKAVEQLKQEIKDAKGVASEKWLLEKLAELE